MWKETKVEIIFKYSKDNPNPEKEFDEQPGEVLMHECDKRSRNKQEELDDAVDIHTIKCVGCYTPVVDGAEKDKNITTLMRELDAKENEVKVVKDALPE